MNKILGVLVGVVVIGMLVVMVSNRGPDDVDASSPAAAAAITAPGPAAPAAGGSSSAPGPDFDRVLAQLAGRANATLPMMVDRNTRWDTTMGGPGKHFTYFYTLPAHASTAMDLPATRQAIGAQVKGNVCGNQDMQAMFKAGVTAHYVYRGNDGVEVVRLEISPSDCAVSPDSQPDLDALLAPA